ncbi:MAG: heme lyase CcmF/NrfE family subunit [Firmicutes bacterium]|nr:heme lyase CcmF/NrfE family subunit [Bacillota bacterium]
MQLWSWLGAGLVIVAAAASGAGSALAFLLAPRGEARALRWARRAASVLLVAVAGASALLVAALAGNRFEFAYVAAHSSRATPLVYRIGAFWGGQEGSLLLWLLFLSLLTAAIAWRPPRGREAGALVPYALGVLLSIAFFFALLIAVAAPPFRLLPQAPADGAGLNRLLRDPSMLLHPLGLYSGFVGLAAPFAFAVAGLLARQTGHAWIRVTRRWALAAWALLSAGILMGANWSYHVLGWGGYWAFDPVENAALMPWLTATAYLHSSIVQEKRGMLKAWNVALVCATYLLTILGTFLTRSGLVTSVHAFAQSPIGAWFLAYIGLVTAALLWLGGTRAHLLRDERPLDSYVSKEGSFLVNNVVFLSLALTVLFGTLLPLVSPLWGETLTVGAPYFTRTTAPLFALVFFLMGVGPLLGWRRASWRQVREHLLVPLVAGASLAVALAAAGVGSLGTVLGFGFAALAMAAVLYDIALAALARRQMTGEPWTSAVARLFARHPRRYGGYLVHLAVALIAMGVIGSTAFQRTATVGLGIGEGVTVAGYDFVFNGMSREVSPYGARTQARVDVLRGGRLVATLLPSQFASNDAEGQAPYTEIAIDRGFTRDLYVVLAGFEPDERRAGFKIYVNPMVDWIWGGGALLILATAFSLWPRGRERRLGEAARLLADWAELEYDYRTGKVAAADYAALRAEYADSARTLLASGSGAALDGEPDALAELEARLRRRAQELRAGEAAAVREGAR